MSLGPSRAEWFFASVMLFLFGGGLVAESWQLTTGAWPFTTQAAWTVVGLVAMGPGCFAWNVLRRITLQGGEIAEYRLGIRLWRRPAHLVHYEARVELLKGVPYPSVAVVEKATGKTVANLKRHQFEGRLRDLLPEPSR